MRLPAFAKDHWFMVAIFAASVLAVAWFGGRMFLSVIYFNDPRHQDEALKAWMTPRYVVMSYDLPRPVVADVLNLPEGGPRGMKMGDIAEEMGITLEELTVLVRKAAAEHREHQQ